MSRDPIPPSIKKSVLRRTEGCVCCGWTKDIELHHIIPWKTTQSHDVWNLIPVCRECHDLIQPNKIVLYDYLNRDCRYKNKIIEIFQSDKSNTEKLNLLKKKSAIKSYKLKKSPIGRTVNYLMFLEKETEFNLVLSTYFKGTGDLELRWITELDRTKYIRD